MNKIAIISDVHGNSFALRAVLEDIRNKSIDTIINLGDSLYGPIDPVGTYELLQENRVISISGNQDRAIIEKLNESTGLITLEFVKSKLNEEIIDWLKSLPFDMVYENKIYGCHASPQSDSEYLLEKLEKDFVKIKESAELESILEKIEQQIIICGHSHVSRIVRTKNKVIINTGSVGLPAYDDELPIYHKMENFNPFANYSILGFDNNSYIIDRIAINYDFESAAKLAEFNGRKNWAKWIRSGQV